MLSGEKGLDVIVKKMSLDLLALGSWMNLVIFVDIIKKDQQQKRKNIYYLSTFGNMLHSTDHC